VGVVSEGVERWVAVVCSEGVRDDMEWLGDGLEIGVFRRRFWCCRIVWIQVAVVGGSSVSMGLEAEPARAGLVHWLKMSSKSESSQVEVFFGKGWWW
jgi:hypothetical protein